MNSTDCFKKRLLRKEKPDPKKSERSLEVANSKLERAYDLFNNEFYEESLVTAYTAMFHGARALLYRDGVVEKSHVCVGAYLRDNYSSTLGQDRIGWLDSARLERHESFYGLETPKLNKEEVEDVLEKAEMFIESVTALLKT